MKRFEELFEELRDKIERQDPDSGSVKLANQGVHEVGKKLLEEAGEAWMACEHEGPDRAAEEISQLLYHAQLMMLTRGLALEDVYRYL